MASTSSQSDIELINIIKTGDSDLMSAVYKSYFGMVRYFVTKNGGTDKDADKVFQETIFVLYADVKKGDFQLTGKLRIIIYNIARNIWYNELRARGTSHPKLKSFEPTVKVNMGPYGELSYSQHEDFKKVEKNFRILGEAGQKMLSQFYFHHKTYDEIAESEKITVDEVKTLKHRYIQNLKRMLR